MRNISGEGKIGNYYGGLEVKEEDGKFYWAITNYDGHDWEEIPAYLYAEIINFEELK